MSFTLQPNPLDCIINDYTEGKLSTAELQSFSELKEQDNSIRKKAEAGIRIRRLLAKLTDVKCRPGFDQRMAAKFALELEREVKEGNKHRSNQPAVSS